MLPFLVGAAALVGAGKTISAIDDMSTAKRINGEAQDLVNRNKRWIEKARSSTDSAIKELGKTKIAIMSGSMKNFVDSFSRIKNVDLSDVPGAETLRGFNPNSQEFLNMKNASFKASELATGGLGAISAGALTAAGAYGAVGAFAAASTGTAISALSGAAATNATLAWLGGGAIAAGGGGIAAGTAMMCGLVAAPALLIGGMFLGDKAETALNDARSNLAQAKKFDAECDSMYAVLTAIKERGDQIRDVLDRLNEKFRPAIGDMRSVIDRNGTDWRWFDQNSKKRVMLAANIAKTLKIVLDTTLLTKEGTVTAESGRALSAGREALAKL